MNMMQNIKKLISECPEAALYLKEKMTKELIDSISQEEAKDVPEDFLELVKETVIDDNKLCIFIKNNPHSFFYYLDERKITIDVFSNSDGKFVYRIENALISTPFEKRKDAEIDGLLVAIDLLQKVLIDEISNIEVNYVHP